ncbi:MAG: PhoH family protein [Streptococcaceae bacterium]|nr:PhoH family protein [Streptococcaceae bacterium]
MTDEQSVLIQLESEEDNSQLFGSGSKHLKFLEDQLDIQINARGETIQLIGDEENIDYARLTLQALLQLIKRGIHPGVSDLVSALKMARNGTMEKFLSMYEEEIMKDRFGKPIRVKTLGQRNYTEEIKKQDVVFGIGPAGTGKTFLAVVLASMALKTGEVKRIVITRPAVEAGESLGFLPGDLKEKVDPYLRPIYDALYQIYGQEQTNRLIERGVIEIAPLAYMRGRTLDDAFVILDEAQNTTVMQMKMFLTRLGYQSKMVINGDETQIDLPKGVMSGLIDAKYTLRNVKKISFVSFDATDVVRHPVVADILRAYESEQRGKQSK